MLAAMRNGEVVAFGPRDEILNKIVQQPGRHVVQHPSTRTEASKVINAEVMA